MALVVSRDFSLQSLLNLAPNEVSTASFPGFISFTLPDSDRPKILLSERAWTELKTAKFSNFLTVWGVTTLQVAALALTIFGIATGIVSGFSIAVLLLSNYIIASQKTRLIHQQKANSLYPVIQTLIQDYHSLLTDNRLNTPFSAEEIECLDERLKALEQLLIQLEVPEQKRKEILDPLEKIRYSSTLNEILQDPRYQQINNLANYFNQFSDTSGWSNELTSHLFASKRFTSTLTAHLSTIQSNEEGLNFCTFAACFLIQKPLNLSEHRQPPLSKAFSHLEKIGNNRFVWYPESYFESSVRA